jgi:hypothetical protein
VNTVINFWITQNVAKFLIRCATGCFLRRVHLQGVIGLPYCDKSFLTEDPPYAGSELVPFVDSRRPHMRAYDSLQQKLFIC